MSAEGYKLVRVTGSDAAEFLQGQLTQDIQRVADLGSLPAAWCNPKGRVITVLRVLTTEGGYGLVLPASLAEIVCDRLTIYRLRADVTLEVAGSDWIHLVFHSNQDMDELEALGLAPERELNACRKAHGLTAVNVGIEEACVEVFGQKSDFEEAGIDTNQHADFEFLSGAKIRAGIPQILGDSSERFTPHMLNLDLSGAISFDKGCYTGQEVVARTENLGRSKRRIMRYRTEGAIASGDRVVHSDQKVGEVINVSGGDLLALTPVDLHDKQMLADGAGIEPMPLPYALKN